MTAITRIHVKIQVLRNIFGMLSKGHFQMCHQFSCRLQILVGVSQGNSVYACNNAALPAGRVSSVVEKTAITDISEIMEINCAQKRRKQTAATCSLTPPTGSGGALNIYPSPTK
jgi:hypothetical protein